MGPIQKTTTLYYNIDHKKIQFIHLYKKLKQEKNVKCVRRTEKKNIDFICSRHWSYCSS